MNILTKKTIAVIITGIVVLSLITISIYIYNQRTSTEYTALKTLLEISYPELSIKYMKHIKINISLVNQTLIKSMNKYEVLEKELGKEPYFSKDFSKAYKYLSEAKKTLIRNPYQALILLRKAQYYLSIIEGYALLREKKLNTKIIRNMLNDIWTKYWEYKKDLLKFIYCGENLSAVIIKSYIVERHLSSAKTWLEQAEYYLSSSQWFMDEAIMYAYIKVSLNNILDAEMIYTQSYKDFTHNYTYEIINGYKSYKQLVEKILKTQDFDRNSYAYTVYLEARGYLDQGKQYYEDSYYTHALFYTMYSYILANIAGYFKEYPDPWYKTMKIDVNNMVSIKTKICGLIREMLKKNTSSIILLIADKIVLDSKRADLLIKYMYNNKRADDYMLTRSYLLYYKTLEELHYILNNSDKIFQQLHLS